MLDIIILLLLLIGAIRGYFTGFVLQSLTLVALFGGVWVGIKYSSFISSYLMKWLDVKEAIAPYISFTLLFIVVIILVHLIGVLITKFIDKSALGVMNRIGGVLFGIFKFAFIMSICMLLIQKIDKKGILINDKNKRESKLYLPISKIAPAIFPTVDFEKIKRGLLNG
jgi:membrane protein required for colicin V production